MLSQNNFCYNTSKLEIKKKKTFSVIIFQIILTNNKIIHKIFFDDLESNSGFYTVCLGNHVLNYCIQMGQIPDVVYSRHSDLCSV